MAKRYSQKIYLFSIYGLLICILLITFFLFTYTDYKSNILETAKKDSENLCVSLNTAITAELDNLSTISMNVVYSNAIKNDFKEFAKIYPNRTKDPSTLIASREKAIAIHNIVMAIIGPYQTASAIKLYTMDGACVEAGDYLKTNTVNLKTSPWYSSVLKLNGYKYLTAPFTDPELLGSHGSKTQKFISLVRLFLDASGQPEGIVEVIQDCDKIFSLASQLENSNLQHNIYVYNARQELIYPYEKEESLDFDSEIVKNNMKKSTSKIIEVQNHKSYLLTYNVIPNYDWTVIVTTPKSSVYASLNNFRITFSLIAVATILFTMLICFYISQRLTKPLQNLIYVANQITLDQVLSKENVSINSMETNIKEIWLLCDSIQSMYGKLCANSQQLLLSKTEENRAKLYATQSLVNPHFLYNSLTTISIMAEEEMNDDIIKMCQSLCDYFRYITSSKEMVVSLKEELFYTKCYLNCMKFRFGEELKYQIHISESTSDIYIPKLIIQPIIENAFKYAFSNTPPWILTITAFIINSSWIIKIEDNGGNLTDMKKNELLNLYENLNIDEELKSMHIGGMGLKNVYLRLKLIYGEDAIFQIDNSMPKRTVFIIGGPIYH